MGYSYLYMQFVLFFFFKQKTAYEMRISDWSSDVCSSDLHHDDDVEQVRHGFQPLELEDDELVGGDVEGRRPVEEVPVSAIRAEISEIERELARDRLQMLDTVEIGCGK